jgi:hypothetical protein
MSNRPATVQEIIEIVLPSQRDLDAPRYPRKRDCIFASWG